MKTTTTFAIGASLALALAASSLPAQAAQGDVYVAAHRTRDGSYVPANVPPSSGGTRLAGSPRRSGAHAKVARNGIAAPIFVRAQTLVR